MSLDQKALALAQAVGLDIKALLATRGDLSALTTTAKANLVAAINELKAGLGSVDLTAVIDDAAGAGVLNKAWSADKIITSLETLKQEILNGAPDAFNTLKEIADYLAANDVNINGLLDLIGKTVRFDAAQSLTGAEQLQACTNIGVNNNELDMVALYTTARGAVPTPPPAAPAGAEPEVTGANFDFVSGAAGDPSNPIINL